MAGDTPSGGFTLILLRQFTDPRSIVFED